LNGDNGDGSIYARPIDCLIKAPFKSSWGENCRPRWWRGEVGQGSDYDQWRNNATGLEGRGQGFQGRRGHRNRHEKKRLSYGKTAKQGNGDRSRGKGGLLREKNQGECRVKRKKGGELINLFPSGKDSGKKLPPSLTPPILQGGDGVQKKANY